MWKNELQASVPNDIFHAHIHLGPPEAMVPITNPQRLKVVLSTFTSFTAEELFAFRENPYSRKQLKRTIAFLFPLRKADYQLANDYIAELTASACSPGLS